MRQLVRRRSLIVLVVAVMVITTIYMLPTKHKFYPKQSSQSRPAENKKQYEYVDKKGIRVIVGHYKGDDKPGINFTAEELNANNFSPEEGAGEGGRPVYLKPHEQIRSKRLFHLNEFNLMVSDKISLDRELEDVRSEDCRALHYPSPSNLPTTSVVIVFHNEAWSTLLRTVHSAINTSPAGLIKEFILVDDASDRSYLKLPLEEELRELSVAARVVHTGGRVGLIQARLLGARQASGHVLTFLDAHCECTKGWLEPLLLRIKENPKAVVCPVIDIINDDTFQYTKSFSLHWGAFNWELHFRWFIMGLSQMDKVPCNFTYCQSDTE